MPGGYPPDRPRGQEALKIILASGKLFCRPIDYADVTGRDLKAVYASLERGEIPAERAGQRWLISVARLVRQVEGIDDPEPARMVTSAA